MQSQNKFVLPVSSWLLLLCVGPYGTLRLAFRFIRDDIERTLFPRLHRLHRVQFLRRVGRTRRQFARQAREAAR